MKIRKKHRHVTLSRVREEEGDHEEDTAVTENISESSFPLFNKTVNLTVNVASATDTGSD